MNHLLVNGGLVDLDDLQEDDLQTVQIARALSRISRFAGNFQAISVAQHAVIVSNVIEKLGGTPNEQLAGLHHDDAEAIVGDVPSMIKEQCETFQAIENAILDVVDSKYQCKTRGPLVGKADTIVSNTELLWHIEMDGTLPRMMADLRNTDIGNGISIAAKTLMPWNSDQALAGYLDRHDDLMRVMAKEASRVLDMAKPTKSLGTGVN